MFLPNDFTVVAHAGKRDFCRVYTSTRPRKCPCPFDFDEILLREGEKMDQGLENKMGANENTPNGL